ncbi:hypothetical protein A2335_00310 [Candidatus Peregrinibacteria bacterium RIFOXYB2_FULL_32_7]|nr:MAG: hypothetical protein A2335_00310 [Candidatus Peregrinibacteria bacterium RIFOXYB2_FULL_32_7]
MSRNILIATSNPGKFQQMKTFLEELNFKFLNLKDFAFDEEPKENGETFEENAIIKAKFYFEKLKIPVIAEDSGILVDAFPNELGVKTRRWGAGEKASDEQWISYFMEKMKDVPLKNRGASFVSCVVFINGKGIKSFQGECQGIITNNLEAPIEAGIPLSSCFKPEKYDKVYAALSKDEKLSVSHRGKAAEKLKKWLTH